MTRLLERVEARENVTDLFERMWDSLGELLVYVEDDPYPQPDWRRMLRERSAWAAHCASRTVPEGPMQWAAMQARSAVECLLNGVLGGAACHAKLAREYAEQALREEVERRAPCTEHVRTLADGRCATCGKPRGAQA